jgi:polyisoprenoid-binding protein YceI
MPQTACRPVRTPRIAIALPLALLLAAAAQDAVAERQHYRLDPVHTRIAFQVSHAGFSNPIGTFAKASGTLDFDPDDWSTAHVEVEVPTATLDLGDAEWQRKILDRTFFDATRFPTARFVSTGVERGAGAHARVTGDLTLHGVTRPLVLEVDLNALRRHPLTFKRTAGFSARGQLSRKAFGIDAWERVVGDVVTLVIEAEAARDGGAGGEDAPAAPAPDAPATPPPADEPHDAVSK